VEKKPPSRRAPASPSAPLELATVSGDAISVAPLPPRGTVTLGRDGGCDVRIDNRSVSRRHAALHVGPTLRIEDLGSANGTFVRDARSPADTSRTQPLRRLSREAFEIAIGERVNLGSVSIVIRRAAAVRAPAPPESAAARAPLPSAPGGAVVRAPAMRALYEQVGRAARGTISVLILGETGVGKEVLARAVHDLSRRARKPFLELNCAALAPSLLEGELFGHEKNAFMGANQARAGLLESADGGTVFLDEVGELPPNVQVKLLRVLEDRKVLRLGGHAPRKLDVRFVAATNRDLEAEIARGAFRQDLYFQLNGVSFVVPPLRERADDIAPLAERFLADASRTLDRAEPPRLSPEALFYLLNYGWPGNVRELRNVIERAAVLSSGDVILPADLPTHLTGVGGARPRAASVTPDAGVLIYTPPGEGPAAPRAPNERAAAARAPGGGSAAGVAAGAHGPNEAPGPADERQRIIDALERCAGNQTRAAKLLGVSLRTLVNRLAEYDVPRPRKQS
jgi:two-component system response regulator AtoC